MRQILIRPFVSAAFIRVTELVIGAVLVLSAWLHLQNQMLFYLHVAQYRLLPTPLIPFFVLTIPWLLLFTGMLIITRSGRPLGAVVGAGLFLLFTVAQLAVMGYGINCGCFGSMLTEEVGLGTALRTGLLFAGCLILALHYKSQSSKAEPIAPPRGEVVDWPKDRTKNNIRIFPRTRSC